MLERHRTLTRQVYHSTRDPHGPRDKFVAQAEEPWAPEDVKASRADSDLEILGLQDLGGLLTESG